MGGLHIVLSTLFIPLLLPGDPDQWPFQNTSVYSLSGCYGFALLLSTYMLVTTQPCRLSAFLSCLSSAILDMAGTQVGSVSGAALVPS